VTLPHDIVISRGIDSTTCHTIDLTCDNKFFCKKN